MSAEDIRTKFEMMKAVVDPWYQALADPATAQETVLEGLLKGYSQTEYGRQHKSENVGSYADYKKAFPVQRYEEYKPLIDKVLAGDTNVLLHEEPVAVAMTRGSSKGVNKLIPITPQDVKNFSTLVPRIIMNYAITKQQFSFMADFSLNLGNTSNLGTMKVGKKELIYGFASAVDTRLVKTAQNTLHSIPTQEEIDELGGGTTKKDWDTRYELVYQKARDKKVGMAATLALNALNFGRYLYRKYNIYPKDIWQIQLLALTSYPGINTRLWTPLHSLYGKHTDIREMYGSTEGKVGAQIDDKKAWCPFYDNLFFEVQTINGIKQLHEMVPGEIGTLIVSTTIFPRYRQCDLILAFEPPYFRCIGRENTKLHPYNFGKLTGKSALNLPKTGNLDSWR